ncbi:MAG: sigma-54 dependent transcriptional regulator [Thermodesulfobacteriota bacterium]|nr:sigma-54 dependent transcriptional regulator [Thermodesulfobacteriota bacterium]
MNYTILIVDDEKTIRLSLKGGLEDEGFKILLAEDAQKGLKCLNENEVDLVLLDIWMPGTDGLDMLEQMKKSRPEIPVIIMTGHGSIDNAIRATRLGAIDFIEKPLDLNRIIVTLTNAMHMKTLEEENAFLKERTRKDDEIIGSSQTTRMLKEKIDRAAPSDAWVLITGENGTGKELVARRLHRSSKRSKGPFIEVNCAAIPEELIESELFGHEKGAFTGATQRKKGKFDQADNGTLFLDEIADMSLSTQAKILRILQEQRFERVGGAETVQVNVRVLTATNKDLEKEIAEGRFRQDLFYRLNVIPIHVPPLSQRKEDIPGLAAYFLEIFSRNEGKPIKTISEDAMKILLEHAWPGNVRELKNIVERMVIMSPGKTINAEELMDLAQKPSSMTQELLHLENLRDARNAFEKIFIQTKLMQCNNNISKTADLIGVERSNLHRKIKGLCIDCG